jgi:hypothetical protein
VKLTTHHHPVPRIIIGEDVTDVFNTWCLLQLKRTLPLHAPHVATLCLNLFAPVPSFLKYCTQIQKAYNEENPVNSPGTYGHAHSDPNNCLDRFVTPRTTVLEKLTVVQLVKKSQPSIFSLGL